MSNLGARVASAVVMVPVILAAVFWLPAPLWRVAVSLVAGFAAREIALLAIRADVNVSWRLIAFMAYQLTWFGTSLPGAPSWLSGGDALLGAIVIVIVVAFVDQLGRTPERRSGAAWAFSVAVPTYVGGMASFWIRLRALDNGAAWVACLLLLVWMNDSAAYFGGRAVGRHPLAPALSPKKTWEGLAVGTIGTIAVALALVATASRVPILRSIHDALSTAPMWTAAALGLAVSIAAPLGDLSHSFLKRQFGAKDSGHAIPGHGGVWDRTDSLLFAAPVVYAVARLLGA